MLVVDGISVKQVQTYSDESTCLIHVGYVKRLKIIPSKTQVKIAELIRVDIEYQEFNEELQQYEIKPITGEFYLKIGGHTATIDIVDGYAQITFSSTEPGEYEIYGDNPMMGSTVGKVVVENE